MCNESCKPVVSADTIKLWGSMSVDNLFPIYLNNVKLRPLIENALHIAKRSSDAQLLVAMTISREIIEEINDNIL